MSVIWCTCSRCTATWHPQEGILCWCTGVKGLEPPASSATGWTTRRALENPEPKQTTGWVWSTCTGSQVNAGKNLTMSFSFIIITVIIIIIINPLTLRVVGAPEMTLQPVFSIFLCSQLPSGTCQTAGWIKKRKEKVRLLFYVQATCKFRSGWNSIMDIVFLFIQTI